MSDDRAARKSLHARSEPASNTLRLVPATPPRLLGIGGHTEAPRVDVKADEQQRGLHAQGKGTKTFHKAPQPRQDLETSHSPILKPKPLPKKRLVIHKDTKTFSLLQDDPKPVDILQQPSPSSSTQQRFTYITPPSLSLDESNFAGSCDSAHASTVPAIPTPELKQASTSEPSTSSPWNYRLVGGLRKVPKSPDPKQNFSGTSEGGPSQSKEILDEATDSLHYLSTDASFHTSDTASTASVNTNYKVYCAESASSSDTALLPLSSPYSSDNALRTPSPASSIYQLHNAATYETETENEHESYNSHTNSSPSPTYFDESLVVPPLIPRSRRSDERLGYYKSRSRESLRTGSLTSISAVLSQQEASRAVADSEPLIGIPFPQEKLKVTSSWALPDELAAQSPRSHMNEHPHQWSSQLSTVHSVSDAGTDRNSRTWSDDNGRHSSGFPSTPSRHSRQLLSVGSSLPQEESWSRSRSNSIEPPQPAFARNGLRHMSNSSIRVVEDQDEYGDGITDMLDLRSRPSRTRLSGFFSVNSSDYGRTNTMVSATSSRANSLLASSIPTWARLYYGSGERRYLGAPGSSTEGTESRASSLLSGSPNIDHFPLGIYSPRRRPRQLSQRAGGFRSQESLNITPAPHLDSSGQLINDPYSRKIRTWSMSSVWSPHLRVDRRATRHSVWEAPSLSWSTEGRWFGRRNLQVVMFIGGFIFPLAWMIAAFYPLPPPQVLEMSEREFSNIENSNLAFNDHVRQFRGTKSARYESAKWWRTLNRWMSLVGLSIIAAVVTLVAVGLKQGW